VRYGARLRELRAGRQLSLRDVEERGGPNKDTMSLIERGVHRPQPQTLGRIAKALDMDVSSLRFELESAERPPLGPASTSQQLTLNGELEEERRAAWESAVESARQLREDGQERMVELLSLWRASRERQEEEDARLECRNEMADLLIQARKAETALSRNITWSGSPEARRAHKEAKKAGAREVPYADWEEYREAARFYYRLLGMVEGQQGLFVRQAAADEAADEAAAEHAQPETRTLRVEELDEAA
jgi:transcriptional regulator with XRE-family HTH domain